VKTVQSSDIESAKSKLLAKISSIAKDKINETAGEEYEIPEKAINVGNAE
jgi:hypothetical protein